MMKTGYCFVILLLFLTGIVNGQDDFRVIKVNGTIVLRAKGVSLETGTVFSAREDLVFRSEDATAAVINSQRGRVVISSRNHDLSAVSSNYLPSMYNISTRGVSMSSNSDLSNHFTGRYVILDRKTIEVDTDVYPLDNTHFFFLRYLYKGEEINKKLLSEGSSFLIDRNTLFTVDGKPIPNADNSTIKLFYRKGNESVFISEFELIFPDMVQLAREIEVILAEMGSKPTNQKINEAGAYIGDFYGNVERDHLAKWLETRFGLK